MYQKYLTEAVVLKSRERGEADRVYALYTKEFGLVWARATAVRREASRMRYALQNYAYSRVSLVRGSGGWRIAGATALVGAAHAERFARIAALVERLVHGEERNDYLFATLAEAHSAFRTASEQHAAIELLCVARILYSLGYVSAEALGTALFTHATFTATALSEAESERTKLLSSVNKALSEAHL